MYDQIHKYNILHINLYFIYSTSKGTHNVLHAFVQFGKI